MTATGVPSSVNARSIAVAVVGVVSLILSLGETASAQPFRLAPDRPDLDRWMYPFNSTPGTRPVAAVFSTFGDESGVDTRHGQFILAWNTGPSIPAGLPADRYLIRSARVTVTVTRGDVFVNDSTADPYGSLLFPDDPAFQPDPDPGRPLELFGTGFRNGFTPATFQANSPFGGAATGRRNAFAAGFAPDGQWVDVGNNVGKTNVLFPSFPTRPFAVGTIPDVIAGHPVPAGARIVFDLDLTDPLVLGYLRSSLREGRLWTTITWLGGSEGFVGGPTFPELATAENLLNEPPRLVIEGSVVGEADADEDDLPDDWEHFHFGGTGADPDADPDHDGVPNRAEWREGTNPQKADALVARQSVDAQGRINLSWPGIANHRDFVESSTDMRSWSKVDGPMDYRNRGLISWSGSIDEIPGLCTYRIRREPAP